MSADYKLAQPVNFKKLLKYAPSIRETFDEDCTADDIKIIEQAKLFKDTMQIVRMYIMTYPNSEIITINDNSFNIHLGKVSGGIINWYNYTNLINLFH